MLDDVGHLPMLDDPALVAALIRDVVRPATR
jgi:pimeloyl-ACP methyl ester carboxylesterase